MIQWYRLICFLHLNWFQCKIKKNIFFLSTLECVGVLCFHPLHPLSSSARVMASLRQPTLLTMLPPARSTVASLKSNWFFSHHLLRSSSCRPFHLPKILARSFTWKQKQPWQFTCCTIISLIRSPNKSLLWLVNYCGLISTSEYCYHRAHSRSRSPCSPSWRRRRTGSC